MVYALDLFYIHQYALSITITLIFFHFSATEKYDIQHRVWPRKSYRLEHTEMNHAASNIQKHVRGKLIRKGFKPDTNYKPTVQKRLAPPGAPMSAQYNNSRRGI